MAARSDSATMTERYDVAVVGLGLSLILAWWPFRETFTEEVGPAAATVGALAEAVFTSAAILWIIIPALAIHQMQVASGAIGIIERALGRVTGQATVTVSGSRRVRMSAASSTISSTMPPSSASIAK